MTVFNHIRKLFIFLTFFTATTNFSTTETPPAYWPEINSANYENCSCDFCKELLLKTKLNAIRSGDLQEDDTAHTRIQKKEWSILIYMAADNNLSPFAERNIRQMSAVGSNSKFNILVHLDIVLPGNQKVSRFYLIEKNLVIHVDAYPKSELPMDSGNPKTLMTFCEHAIKNFPAEHYMLIFWNHGTGILDPHRARVINPSHLYQFNPFTNKFDLDRSKSYLALIETLERGVCWDDTTGNYLPNTTLANTIAIIRKECMKDKKIDIIGFDACLMSMTEVASLLEPHADVMVASQELELGTGWNYYPPLAKLYKSPLSPEDLAREFVSGYAQSYASYTDDYTLSATRLSLLKELEVGIDKISTELLNALEEDRSTIVLDMITKSRDKRYCTVFEEPSYIDLHHFITNLKKNLSLIKPVITVTTYHELNDAIDSVLTLFEHVVIANATGRNLNRARGLSIYFPLMAIHSSYKINEFFKKNAWGKLITTYLQK